MLSAHFENEFLTVFQAPTTPPITWSNSRVIRVWYTINESAEPHPNEWKAVNFDGALTKLWVAERKETIVTESVEVESRDINGTGALHDH